MTPQEKSMIDELVERIRTTSVADKDSEVERYLQQTLGSIPDALYILTQTVLVQQYGLTQAQAQLQVRQDELDELKRHNASAEAAPKAGGSFLSRIFGSDDSHNSQSGQSPAQDPSAYQRVNYAPAQGSMMPPPPAGAPGYGGPVYGSGPAYGAGYGGPGYGGQPLGMPGGFGGSGFGGGGFLRGALQTAAGVAAGEMAFRGMEDLFHGFGGGESRGLAGSPGETVVNNYYDGNASADGGREGSRDDSSFYNPSQDASRQDLDGDRQSESRDFGGFTGNDPGSGSQFADTGSSDGNDDGDFSDSDSDDSGSNDFSDDGSGGDGGDDSNY